MDRFTELTAFLPILRNDPFGEWVVDRENDGSPEHPIRLPFVRYTAGVDRFVKTLYRFCDAHPEFDHTSYAETLEEHGLSWSAHSMRSADVSRADAKLVIALLMGAVRADRFSEGTLLEFCSNGCIVRWLERLREIDTEEDPLPPSIGEPSA